ncbi:glycosyltransferase [Deltaproteobacteria bacterium TL4]
MTPRRKNTPHNSMQSNPAAHQNSATKTSLAVLTSNESPKRIMQINGRADLSGGPIYMLELISRLNPERFEHFVLCPPEKNGILAQLQNKENCHVTAMNIRSFSLITFFKILWIARKSKIDLIHSHGKAAGIYGRLVGKFTNIPVIHHLHGIHYRQYPAFLQKCYFYLEKQLSRWTQKVICVSPSEQDEGLSAKMFTSLQSTVVPNGVNVDKFIPAKHLASALKQKWSIPENARVITSITRYCYQKNIPLTLEIHQKICEHFPETYLVLIGVSSKNSHVQRLLRALPKKNKVILIEHETEMNQLLNISDIYLNTSRWEGLSLGVIEAMALEIPVVLSDVVGNHDIENEDFKVAFLIKGEKEESYVDAIRQIFENPDLAQQTGANLRQQVLSQFTLIENAKAMEKEYLSCINKE